MSLVCKVVRDQCSTDSGRLAKAPETREVWGDRKSAADVQINVVVNVARATPEAIADAQSMVDVTPVTAASDLTPGNR